MQMEKKRIMKEDGRYLVLYHFPESATLEESAVFAVIADATGAGLEPEPNEVQSLTQDRGEAPHV
jgi:hypothetical protein